LGQSKGKIVKVSVFGMGYVGSVVAGCFARDGHEVLGVDVSPAKIDLINSGKAPVIEPGLDDMMAAGVRQGRLRATADHHGAVLATEISMICVGTPARPMGDLDLRHVLRVCESIGESLRDKEAYHLVVVRSTMLPGSVEEQVIPQLERSSGKQEGQGFGVLMNPEFLRESCAVQDFYQPSRTVIGARRQCDADKLAELYRSCAAPVIVTSLKVAEMVKYADNVFHALKVAFGNEIGSICKEAGADSQEVMEIFCQDRKLNLSPVYLKPGFAYGGSCLPKDLQALGRFARSRDVVTPLLNAIAVSNEQQIANAFRWTLEKGKRRVGVLGFAFKEGTDDLRQSPMVTLVEMMLGKGLELQLYDRNVALTKLLGANRQFIEEHIPHISRLMVSSIDAVIESSDLILIGNRDPAFFSALSRLRADQHVLDLTPGAKPIETIARYERLNG
jgi:GDP-mannose 6-dehydrogenase